MISLFDKAFFKFLFGFLGVVALVLAGIAVTNRYFESDSVMFASTSDAR